MSLMVEHKGDMLFQVRCGTNKLLIDVPPSLGGKDRAMNPTEVFAASLAACVGALMAKAANAKGVDTTGLRVKLDYDYVQDPLRMDNFKVKVKLPNDECKAIQDDLMKAAHTCPVHETLQNDVTVEFAFEE